MWHIVIHACNQLIGPVMYIIAVHHQQNTFENLCKIICLFVQPHAHLNVDFSTQIVQVDWFYFRMSYLKYQWSKKEKKNKRKK